jgi:glycosyltransferase involved in cell wall biosynthesis
MAAGLPAVATAVGGNVDALADDVSGLLVPAKDPRILADAIRRLANDPTLRSRLGRAARLRVQQHFSLDACISRYEKLYRAMNGPAAAPLSEILADQPSAV